MTPSGWRAVSLGEAATLQRGFDLPVQDRTSGPIPVVASNGPVGTHNVARVAGPGVVTGRSGTIGKVFYYETSFWPLNTTLYVADFHGNDPQFIVRLLAGFGLEKYVASTGVPSLNRNFVHPLPVVLPPLGEQRKIAAILSSVDDAIEATQAVIEQLQVVKKAMMAELLTRGLPGRHTRFKMTEIGEIPEGWEVRELGRLCTRLTDGSHQAVKTTLDGEVPFLFVSCVRDGRIVWQNAGRIPRATYDQISRGREPKPGLILYTAVGSYGHAALVPEESGPFAFQRHLAYVLPDSAIVEPAFVASWLNGPWAKDHADRVAVGNAQKTVTLGKLNAFPVPCPNRDEQRAIADAISRLEERTESEVTNAEGLRALKGALMSVLLTGEVRVKPDKEAT